MVYDNQDLETCSVSTAKFASDDSDFGMIAEAGIEAAGTEEPTFDDLKAVDASEAENLDIDDEIGKIDEGSVPDTVAMYINNLRNYPLLTPEEEVKYGKMYLEEKSEYARQRLIEGNLRLVIAVAKHYINKGYDYKDLIQEGNLGLIKAVERYDYRKGYRFSTYAHWWIRQAITRSIAANNQAIRVPFYKQAAMAKVAEAQRKLTQEFSREPTTAEIADELGMSEAKVRRTLSSATKIKSLSDTLKDDDDTTVEDMIPDDGLLPEERMEQKDTIINVNEILLYIPYKPRNLLRLRFGMINGHRYTLEEIGEEFHLTRERIRQMQNKTLAAIKDSKEHGAAAFAVLDEDI